MLVQHGTFNTRQALGSSVLEVHRDNLGAVGVDGPLGVDQQSDFDGSVLELVSAQVQVMHGEW